jgi:hypothetical protein
MTLTLLDLPIYWRSAQQHAAFFEKRKQEEIREAEAHPFGGPEWIDRVRSRPVDGLYTWMYNDVVGWIRLSVHMGLFEFGVFIKQSGRGRRRDHDVTIYDGSIAKVHGSLHDTSAEIADDLIAKLDQICKEEPLKGCHVPRDDFRQWACFMDWKGLGEFSSSPPSA